MMSQDAVFSEGEGDAWYERNRHSYQGGCDPIIRTLVSQKISQRNILEIGASRGASLAELQQYYQANATAVEPSEAAVADWRKSFPAVQFLTGTAKYLPLADESYDCVIVNAVFHWIDR